MNQAIEWLPLIVTLLVYAGLFLSKNWFAAKIKAGVEHEFNLKLEKLRSDLRSKESEIRDHLQPCFRYYNKDGLPRTPA